MSMIALAFVFGALAPGLPIDAEEAGRVAFVRFTEAAGRSALDPVVEGLREADAIVLTERPQCGAPDLDALACLKDADRSVGVVLQLGASIGDDARVVATIDCAAAGLDRYVRLLGGPFASDTAARAWGREALADALRARLVACDVLPARVTTENALPAGTVVALDGERLATLDVERSLDVVGLESGRRRFSFENEDFEVAPLELDARAGTTVSARARVDRIVNRPRWLFLSAAGASLAAGAALFGARHDQRSGRCVTTGDTCDVDAARDARLEGQIDLGVPATMLVAGGTGLAVSELALPRKEPWWLVTLIGAASAGLSALPWLF